MPQLPRVAVLDSTLTGVLAVEVLVDGGLDATLVGPLAGDLPELVTQGATRDHWIDTAAGQGPERAAHAAMRGGQDGDAAPEFHPVVTRLGGPEEPRGFEVTAESRSLGTWDAVVVTTRTLRATAGLSATEGPWYGGVVHPLVHGLFRVGVLEGTETPYGQVLAAQASWISEYLRGRYRPPAREAMVELPSLPRARWTDRRRARRARHVHSGHAALRGPSSGETSGVRARVIGLNGRRPKDELDDYLAALDRELWAGRARAAAAGYPLPLPAAAVVGDRR